MSLLTSQHLLIHCMSRCCDYTLYLTLPMYCTYITLVWESSRNLPSGELCSSCCSLSSFASMSMAKVMNPRVRGGVNKRLCLWKLMQRSSWSWSAITYFTNFCSCWANLTHLNAKKISNSRVRFSGETKYSFMRWLNFTGPAYLLSVLVRTFFFFFFS